MKINDLLFSVACRRAGITAGLVLACTLAQADVLELKNGKVLNGKYAGGTAATVRFSTGTGTEVIETSQIVALTFTGAARPPRRRQPQRHPPRLLPLRPVLPSTPGRLSWCGRWTRYPPKIRRANGSPPRSSRTLR